MSSTVPTAVAADARAPLTLAALSFLFFVVTAGTFSSLGVVLPDMVATLGWTWTQAGLGFTILAVACGLASYAPTLVIRTLGVRATLILGGAVMAAGFACLYAVHGVGLYYVGAGLEGLGFALTAIIPGAYVLARSFRRVSAALGVYFTVGGLGGVAGPWLYFLVRSASGDWRAYWVVLAIACLFLGPLAALSVRDLGEDAATPSSVEATADPKPPIHRTTHDWSVRQALGAWQFWVIVAAYTTNLLVEVTVNSASVAHLTGRGVSAGVAGAVLSLQALVSVAARGVGGALGERIDPRKLTAVALGMLALGVAALAVSHGGASMFGYAFAVGAGYGLNYLAATVLLLNYFGRGRNLELFSTMALISTAAALGPVLAGQVKDTTGDFSQAFWIIAGVSALTLVAVATMRPPKLPG
ncbi:MAG: MFS transporter [Caulobacteraceae bacterium]